MTASLLDREFRTAPRRFYAQVLAVLAVLLWIPFAAAQPHIVLDPATVTLSAGGSDRVLVRVEGALSGRPAITVSDPTSIKSTVEPLGARRRQTRQWIVTLAAGPDFDEDATAIVKLRSGSQVSAVPLPIKAKSGPSAESLFTATLSFEGETLLDGLERPLLVRVTNLSDLPLDVTLEPRLPQFLVANGDDWKAKSVAPRSTVIVRIPLSTDGTGDHPVISGKHEVAIVVGARRNGSSRWSGQAVASTALAVGVPGMEAVQGVLQVPSFLLLPGFLFVAAYLLTAKLVRGRAPPETEKEGFLSLGWSAGHWLVAITISMLLIGLYPLLMNVWLGSPRNILYGFDLGDVIRVWVISLLLGGLGALVAAAIRSAVAAWIARSAFNVDLAPLDFLDRLARRGTPATLPFVVLDDGRDSKLFSLLCAAGDDQAWAASAIEVTILDHSKFDSSAFGGKVRAGKAADLKAYLEQAIETNAARLGWALAGTVRGVAKVPAAEFGQAEGPGPIIASK